MDKAEVKIQSGSESKRLPQADRFQEVISLKNYTNHTIPTLTLNEAVEKFRDLGVSISETTLKKGLLDGAFPFGVVIKSPNPNGRDSVYIFEKLLNQWIDQRAELRTRIG